MEAEATQSLTNDLFESWAKQRNAHYENALKEAGCDLTEECLHRRVIIQKRFGDAFESLLLDGKVITTFPVPNVEML